MARTPTRRRRRTWSFGRRSSRLRMRSAASSNRPSFSRMKQVRSARPSSSGARAEASFARRSASSSAFSAMAHCASAARVLSHLPLRAARARWRLSPRLRRLTELQLALAHRAPQLRAVHRHFNRRASGRGLIEHPVRRDQRLQGLLRMAELPVRAVRHQLSGNLFRTDAQGLGASPERFLGRAAAQRALRQVVERGRADVVGQPFRDRFGRRLAERRADFVFRAPPHRPAASAPGRGRTARRHRAGPAASRR